MYTNMCDLRFFCKPECDSAISIRIHKNFRSGLFPVIQIKFYRSAIHKYFKFFQFFCFCYKRPLSISSFRYSKTFSTGESLGMFSFAPSAAAWRRIFPAALYSVAERVITFL